MLIDAVGRFLSQREIPRMAQVQPQITDSQLEIRWPGGEMAIPLQASSSRFTALLWKNELNVALANEVDFSALSEFLGQPVRIVRYDETTDRKSGVELKSPGSSDVSQTRFTDRNLPIHVINAASVRALAAEIGVEISPEAFRPNVVIDVEPAMSEELWRTIHIAGNEMTNIDLCTRCVITSLHPHTGEVFARQSLKGILNLRSRFRNSQTPPLPSPEKTKADFGLLMVPKTLGTWRVGQEFTFS